MPRSGPGHGRATAAIMDKKQPGSGKKAQALEPGAPTSSAQDGRAENGSASETIPSIVAGEGAIPAVIADPADIPASLMTRRGTDPGTIPVVAALLPDDGTATDLDIKAPEMERSLDRAK